MLPKIGPLKRGCRMSPRSKREYLEVVFLRYKRANKKQKMVILDEFCFNCNYHRKHAILVLRKFKRFTAPKPRKRGKPSRYATGSIMKPLKAIWLAANLACSKRLKATLPLWLPAYTREYNSFSLFEIMAILSHLRRICITRTGS